MPIVDIQERFRELGRIRMGAQVPVIVDGKPKLRADGTPITHPAKLAHFRLTTPWRYLLDDLVAQYGGEVKEWAHPDGTQYELIVQADALEVIIPPGEVLTQWYELWSGGGCVRRCDGKRQVMADRPCACPDDPAERNAAASANPPTACKPTTRLLVMLPTQNTGDLGVWRVESKGWNAATELAGAAALVELATRRGVMIPAVLRLEPRTSRKVGQAIRRFAVPVLSFRGSLGDTLQALGFTRPDGLPIMPGVEARPALDVGGPAALPAAPVGFGATAPELEPATMPTLADADDLDEPEPPDPPPFEGADPEEARASLSWAQMASIRGEEAGLTDDMRHGLYGAITAGRTTRGEELEPMQRHTALAAIIRLQRGDAALARDDQGTSWALIGRGTGIEHSCGVVHGVTVTIVAGPATSVGAERMFPVPT